MLALGSVRQGLFKSPDEQVDHAGRDEVEADVWVREEITAALGETDGRFGPMATRLEPFAT